MWTSEAFALIAFSIRRFTRRTTGASKAMSRREVRSSPPTSSPRSSSPIVSMTFWTAVEPAPKYRSIASRIDVSVATASRTSSPSVPRSSSTTVGAVGCVGAHDHQHPVLDGQGAEAVLAHVLGRESLEERRTRGELVAHHVGDLEVAGQGLRDVLRAR